MSKAKEKTLGFEESLRALEKIVAQLESGELPLERALEIFEEGIGLARRCQAQLDDAERKVEILLRERGEIKTVSFQPNLGASVVNQEKPASLSLSVPDTFSNPPQTKTEEIENPLDDSFPF